METSIFDLIFLSETWLNDDFTQSEVKVTNYDIYRSDRDPIVSGRSRGGGVLIAVSTYEVSENPIPEYPRLDCIDFNYCSFSPSEIYKALSSLPQKFSSGPDMVPPYILKMCAAVLANPLSALFNASLSAGVFPSKWKSSFIFPIHKSGDRSNIANYRGVCIQSSIPKVLDKLVSSDLSFACKQFISDQQHGFTTKRSTVTNLLCYQYDILRSFQSGNTVHSIYTDVAKAFDRVNTKFLVAKLRSYGIGDAFLRWLDSSFTDRTQIVKIGDNRDLTRMTIKLFPWQRELAKKKKQQHKMKKKRKEEKKHKKKKKRKEEKKHKKKNDSKIPQLG
ncbi:hypothetical protein M8J77_025037 [Diaphorina citri]|nr:hypothetical protein M8J77_025037 [Diaphorina citri]